MASIYSDTNSPLPAAAATSHPSRRVALINACLRLLWESGVADEPSLNADRLIIKASRRMKVGAERLTADWRARLALLTHDLAQSADLTPLGRTIAHGQLVSASANMLGMLDLWERHPEIAEQPIECPILVVGQMRSGTTRMQRLLACDTRFRFTHFYESWNPLPRMRARCWFDDRPWRARAALLAARGLNPAFAGIHPTSASAADEEIGLFNLLMVPAAFEAQWRLPCLVRHSEAMDSRPVYRDFRRMLQTIAWVRQAPEARPWILKVPQFAEDLAALLVAFPDARIIHLTRAQDQVVASAASLVVNQMELQSNTVDRIAIGREWQRKVALRDTRIAGALAATDRPQVTIDYDDVERDWEAAMVQIYSMLGMRLTDRVRGSMAKYLDRAGRASHHRHQYDPAEFGLEGGSSAMRTSRQDIRK